MADSPQPSGAEPGSPFFSRFDLLTLYLPAIILALGSGIATPAIPVFAKSFGTGFGVASLVIIVHTLGALCSTIPTGFLLDRMGRRPILLGGPLLTALSSFLIALARSFPELLLYRFIGGWASEMWRQSRLAVIADSGRQEQRGRQMTGMVAMESGGRLLGPALGGFLAVWNIRVPFVAHGLLSLTAILPSFRLMPKRATATTTSRDPSVPGAGLGLIFDRQFAPFFAAQFFATMSRGTLWGGTLLLYAAYVYDVGPEVLGMLSTAVVVVGIPITFYSGYLMDRFGRKTTIVPGFILIAAGFASMALTDYRGLALGAFIAAFVGVHAAQSLTSGNMQVLGADMAPESARGRFFGVWRLTSEVGHLSSPAIFALLAESVDYATGFCFLSLSAFAAAAIVGMRVRETHFPARTRSAAGLNRTEL